MLFQSQHTSAADVSIEVQSGVYDHSISLYVEAGLDTPVAIGKMPIHEAIALRIRLDEAIRETQEKHLPRMS